MPLIADADSTTRGLDEQFLELIYADPDWVQAEFDEIVAAEWPSPPPAEPGRNEDRDGRPFQARPWSASSAWGYPDGNTLLVESRWVLPRSPPTPTPNTTEVRKGR
jgi:hypothetical protein